MSSHLRIAAVCAFALAMLPAAAFAQASPAPSAAAAADTSTAVAPKAGPKGYLVDARGMTLYIYDKDTAGTSTCTGGCAVAWPPLLATSAAKPAGKFTLIIRADGTKQWAYDGKALYFWKADEKAGDQTGSTVGNWHLLTPAP